jgi:hypothetical protein
MLTISLFIHVLVLFLECPNLCLVLYFRIDIGVGSILVIYLPYIYMYFSENNVIICTVCRVHCRSKNIIENQFLLEAGSEAESVRNESKTSDLKCTSCQVDNAPATSWCVDCGEYICDGCVQVGCMCDH